MVQVGPSKLEMTVFAMDLEIVQISQSTLTQT